MKDMLKQGDFIGQEKFDVCWNDHLVNYFSLIHHFGIDTNLLAFIFSRALFS